MPKAYRRPYPPSTVDGGGVPISPPGLAGGATGCGVTAGTGELAGTLAAAGAAAGTATGADAVAVGLVGASGFGAERVVPGRVRAP